MWSYILKRTLSLIPILFIVSLVIFFIIHLTPGDPVSYMLGDEATEEQINNVREEMGLNLPIYEQYFHWIANVLKGDFGVSFHMNTTVLDAIFSHVAPTLSLAIFAQVIALLIAIPLGIIAAIKRGTIVDQAVMGLSLLGMAVPSFLLALFLVLLIGVHLQWLPIAGYQPLSSGLWNHLKYLILPAISLGSIQAALIARMTRSSMLEVLNNNYINMARSKGVSERKVIYSHALHNAFLPILTVIGQTFGALVTGAVITETIFNIPGLGQLIINSVERRDYTVIQGIVLFVTFIYVMLNLLIDLLYGVVDPRVRLDEK
ncbi:ABC transporter permease [Siminovitchia terrae]|uniref:ABC transporter permease n=1 Tax=Siminovitchia terrae TaxID=1914933 RepID=A0A429X3X6_SIMTE|nr:ABC transporter permease [Siminovitchia terrae]RST58082.1 ABC transporter permease [Siminovitchia terrae]GIN91573.1 ABC transporter permease [Siminovitchia terrae]GIN95663.1 ABC transporter permease [Siminovitchia terrae]